MNAIKGTWRNGHVILDRPAGWPDGCRIQVEPVAEEDTIGIPEEDWPTTPEAIAEWLEWFDAFEPVQLTAEEEAEWRAARQAAKEHTIAKMHRRVEGLFP